MHHWAQGTHILSEVGCEECRYLQVFVQGSTCWGSWRRRRAAAPQARARRRLRRAGAVLVAKLATGEMAFDDVWWGGMVKNPWNIAQARPRHSLRAAGLLRARAGAQGRAMDSMVSPRTACDACEPVLRIKVGVAMVTWRGQQCQ